MSSFSFDDLFNTIRKFEVDQPQFNNQAIDDMIAKGNKISDLVMVHSMPELRDMDNVKTKHGFIEIRYTKPIYLEYGKAYIIKKYIGLDLGYKSFDSTESTRAE